jgi:hypothetical protein
LISERDGRLFFFRMPFARSCHLESCKGESWQRLHLD